MPGGKRKRVVVAEEQPQLALACGRAAGIVQLPGYSARLGRDATSRTFWDGGALVVRTEMKTAKNDDEEIEDRYELSEDGATLTTTSHVVTSKGDVTMKLVSDKEKVGG